MVAVNEELEALRKIIARRCLDRPRWKAQAEALHRDFRGDPDRELRALAGILGSGLTDGTWP